jgi:hypothetical protein
LLPRAVLYQGLKGDIAAANGFRKWARERIKQKLEDQ